MKMKEKTFSVNIDMVWSMDYVVKAKTKSEAKKKAWDKFKKNPPKKIFRIEPQQED